MTEEMINAIISVLIICETGNGYEPAPSPIADYRVNPTSGAAGCLQITERFVDDCNRIAKGDRYWWYCDRFDRPASVEMAKLYLSYYIPRAESDACRRMDPVDVARMWNGGPDGWRETFTEAYGERFAAVWDAWVTRQREEAVK